MPEKAHSQMHTIHTIAKDPIRTGKLTAVGGGVSSNEDDERGRGRYLSLLHIVRGIPVTKERVGADPSGSNVTGVSGGSRRSGDRFGGIPLGGFQSDVGRKC